MCAIFAQMNTNIIQKPHSDMIQLHMISNILFYSKYFVFQIVVGPLFVVVTLPSLYDVKHIVYVPKIPEEFIKYCSKYSIKRLKWKISGDF